MAASNSSLVTVSLGGDPPQSTHPSSSKADALDREPWPDTHSSSDDAGARRPSVCTGAGDDTGTQKDDPMQSTRSPQESSDTSTPKSTSPGESIPAKTSDERALTPDGAASGETLRLGSISRGHRSTKVDSNRHLSAVRQSGSDPHFAANLPLLLTVFVCAIAAVCGLVVTGVHYLVLYSGCPLGINGCNDFHHMEKEGFFLVRWVLEVTDPGVPEGLVYIVVALLGALVYCSVLTRLPERTVFEIKGGGTLQSLVAVATGERILLSDAVLRLLATGLYLGTGGSLGGEGPAIQVCTAISMAIGWGCGIGSSVTQSLLASLGFVCGFAASFNAPVAGILFAMEELAHVSPSLEKSMICCIMVASVVATATLRSCYGDTHIFKVQWTEQSRDLGNSGFGQDFWMLVAVPIGLVCSFVGAGLVLGMRGLNKLRVRYAKKCPYTVLFSCQAVLVALIGMGVFRATGLRGVWGIGAGSLQKALKYGDQLEVWDYLIFAIGKAAAMLLAVTVRAPGDVLEPVLIIGGFTGGTMGRILCYVLEVPSDEVMSPCIVFGMVGLFASCFRFPLTPIVIVGEITGVESYSYILPTALAGFTAMTASSRLFRPILDEIMHEDDIDLHSLMEEVKLEEATHEERRGSKSEAGNDGEAEDEGEGEVPPANGERRNSRGLFNMEEMLHDLVDVHSPRRASLTKSYSKSSLTSGMQRERLHSQSSHWGTRNSDDDFTVPQEDSRSRWGASLGEEWPHTAQTSCVFSASGRRTSTRSRARTRSDSFATATSLVGGSGVR